MVCPLCSQASSTGARTGAGRKARRACPALGQQICTICCGTKRLAEIACPADCVYLEAAERHPAAVARRRHEHDILQLMSAAGPLSEAQLQILFVLETFITRFIPSGGLMRLADADVAAAAGAIATSLEAGERGVVYEERCEAAIAEELRRALRGFLDEVGRGAGVRFDREVAGVLRAIERGARHQGDDPGPGDSTYLELVRRVLRERPGAGQAAPAATPDEPRIIITG